MDNHRKIFYIHEMKNRRTFIQSAAIASAGMLASKSFAFNILHKNIKEEQLIGHNGFKYKVDKEWAKINPSSHPLINCHEMVQDSKGRLFMVGDDVHNNIMVFDKSGKLLDSWGNSLSCRAWIDH